MLYNDTAQLKEELRELFRERITKSELLSRLAVKLKDYRHVKDTLFRHLINEFIVLRAEDDCEIIIHDDEINWIWG